MKFINNLSKRKLYITYSFLFFILGLFINGFLFKYNFLINLLSIIVTISLVLYSYDLKNKSYYSYEKLFFITFFLLGSIFLPYMFPNISFAYKVIYFLCVSIQTYLVFLAFNVYTVSEKYSEQIPLLQAARLVVYISVVILSFIISTIIYKLSFFDNYPIANLLFKIIMFGNYNYFLFKSLHWFFVDEKIGEVREKKVIKYYPISLYVSVALTQMSVILIFFPYESFASGIVVSAATYIGLSIVQAFLNHRLDNKFLLEYSFILGLVLFIAYFIS